MIAIRGEIQQVADGEVTAEASVLRDAPHTAHEVAGEWAHGYDRMLAAYPRGVHSGGKYWPPVGRIDGAYGDRHLICSCPSPEAFED